MKLSFVKKAAVGARIDKNPSVTCSLRGGRLGFNIAAAELLGLQPELNCSIAQDEEENFFIVVSKEELPEASTITIRKKSYFCAHSSGVNTILGGLPAKDFADATTVLIPIAKTETKYKELPHAQVFGLLTSNTKVLRTQKGGQRNG